jgi:hypothetical protein
MHRDSSVDENRMVPRSALLMLIGTQGPTGIWAVYTSIDTLPKLGRRQRCGTLGQTTTHSCVPSVFPPLQSVDAYTECVAQCSGPERPLCLLIVATDVKSSGYRVTVTQRSIIP